MTKYWSLRDELYRSLHQWPTIAIYCILGCVIGWALAYLWPASFKATAQVYVGLNPYTAYSDSRWLAIAKPKYSNIDDYKNWQMSELSSAIFLDEIIEESLVQLREVDSYWEGITADELKEMLEAEWRTAGEWNLIAENKDSDYAAQAVQIWSDEVIQNVTFAVSEAQFLLQIDEKIQKLQEKHIQKNIRYEQLRSSIINLDTWKNSSHNFPSDQPLNPSDRWQILSSVNSLAAFTPAWSIILENQPAQDALPEDYSLWITEVVNSIEQETLLLDQEIEIIERDHIQLVEQYEQILDNSLGLSPNLVIENLKTLSPKPVRPIGILTIVGGIAGFSIWVLTQLIRITQEEKNHDE